MFTEVVKVPAPVMAIAAMVSVQLGAALSTQLFDALTPAGSIWLRMVFAAFALLVLTRPRFRRIGRRAFLVGVLLGAVTGLMMLFYIEALARIPLGTTSAIEFLGPLGVAALRSHRRRALVWPALALCGVVGLAQPWSGHLDYGGIAFACGAAAGWAGYILLTEKVGQQIEGLQGLAISLTVGAIVIAPFGAGPAIGGLTPVIAAAGLGLAVLAPLLPFALEFLALRRMRVAAFGTLMAVEPGIAAALGLIVLGQIPDVLQAAGVVLVVIAGIGAQRSNPAVVPATPTQ